MAIGTLRAKVTEMRPNFDESSHPGETAIRFELVSGATFTDCPKNNGEWWVFVEPVSAAEFILFQEYDVTFTAVP